MEEEKLSEEDDRLRAAVLENCIGDVINMIRLRTKAKYTYARWDIHRAVALGQLKAVQYLLLKEQFVEGINELDENGRTPLMLAVITDRYDIAQALLAVEHCDVTVIGDHRENVLHAEAEKESSCLEMASLLVKHGTDLEAQNVYGMTPFRKAVEYHNVTLARFLCAAGCDVNTACSVQGSTPLHAAVQEGHEDMVKWLALHPRCKVNLKDADGHTPLMLCVQQRKEPHLVFLLMKHLLEAGSQLNHRDAEGCSALLLAMSNPVAIRRRHIELLLLAGANPNLANRDGLTPLWQAVYTGTYNLDRLEIIQLLIQENCDLDTACRGKLLFRCGVDSVYCYETSMTPLEVAMDSGLYEAAKILVLAGCLVKPDMRYEMPLTDTPQELVWFREVFETPVSLEHLSRLAIRNLLGKSVQSKVRKLPLPEKIKSYLLLEDVFEEFNARK